MLALPQTSFEAVQMGLKDWQAGSRGVGLLPPNCLECVVKEVLQLWGLGGDSRYEIGEWLPNRP